MTTYLRTTLLAALVLLLPAGMASAVLINLDVQDHGTADNNNPTSNAFIDPAADGVPSLQNFSDQWNYHSSGSAGSTTALSDVNGGTTGITFELLNTVTTFTASNAQIGGAAPWDDMLRDIYFTNGVGGVQSKLTGLDVSGATTYDLYVASPVLGGGNWNTITVTGAGGPVSLDLSDPANGGNSILYLGGAMTQGGQYQFFPAVVADANGEILINNTDYQDNGGQGRLAGLQIVVNAVPEPSSALLIGCVGFIASLVRRRS